MILFVIPLDWLSREGSSTATRISFSSLVTTNPKTSNCTAGSTNRIRSVL